MDKSHRYLSTKSYHGIEIGEHVSLRLNKTSHPKSLSMTDAVVVEKFGKNLYRCQFDGNCEWFVREDIYSSQDFELAVKKRYGY
jgi:hypothetical protein